MNKKLILIATIALVLTGCGSNDDATTGTLPMLDKVIDSADDAVNDVKDTRSDVDEGAGDNMATDSARTEEMSTEEALEYMDKEMEKISGE